MANLPDINTANVGLIAFWNAEDHKTAGVVDPTDCTGVFTNYSVYDNGIDGDISLGSGRLFNCRVKNDGWCVAWIDRTNTFGWPNKAAGDFGETAAKGYYDVLWDWVAHSASISSTLTTLSYIISLFEAALETSGDFTFSAGDVGHYCYEHTNANVLTMLDIHANNEIQTGQVQYTTGTTMYYAAITGRLYHHVDSVLDIITFAGNTLDTTAVGGNQLYSATDILAEGMMPDQLTYYSLFARYYRTHSAILIIWS